MFSGHHGTVEEEIVGARFQLCFPTTGTSDLDRRVGTRENDSPLYEAGRGGIVVFIYFGVGSEDHQD